MTLLHVKQVTERNIKKSKLCFYNLWQFKHVFQIEMLKNVKYVPAKELVPAIMKIQFFKQGPAYKKEGPDPNKGSNQQ